MMEDLRAVLSIFFFQDIDECLAENVCHNAATCHNLEGSYYCKCDEGYVGDGFHCKS